MPRLFETIAQNGRTILYILVGLVVISLSGVALSSQFSDHPKCTTDKILTAPEVRARFPGQWVICGDDSYAEVNPAFASKWHDYMGKVMYLLGSTTSWSERLDCNRFVTIKLAVIYLRYLVDTWHQNGAAQSPAVGEFWYTPDNGEPDAVTKRKPTHAVIVDIEGGLVSFRDIYTEHLLLLSPAERASAFLIKF